jgi:hypothetical protein
MGKRARRKRIYRMLRAEGISKRKSTAAAKRLARNLTTRSAKSRRARLGRAAKTISLHRPSLHHDH